MRKAMLAFILLAALSAAQTVTEKQFAATSGFALELGSSWQTLAVMAILLSGIIAALGYAVGVGLEMPEVKAWASSELVQIVTNAIIIVLLVACIVFLDGLVIAIVSASNLPIVCNVGESCLNKVTTEYLSSYVDTAQTLGQNVVKDNIAKGAWASRRVGLTCLTIYCLQAGLSTSVAAQYVLDMDYYAVIFEYTVNLLSFMEAQKFFVTQIAFKMAPVLLALGVLGRCFFFTRKLGGLLMAIAIGVMFFFPGMYIFDWATLDFALNGDKSMSDEERSCPEECSAVAPLAYYYYGPGNTKLGTLNSTLDIALAFDTAKTAEADKATSLLKRTALSQVGSNSSSTAYDKTIYSCYYNDSTHPYAMCPAACRELPYPQASPSCAAVVNQTYCYQLPKECKVVRKVVSVDMAEYAKCPESCKVVPPLKSDCRDTEAGKTRCAESRFDCRMASRNDLKARPTPPDGPDEPELACNQSKYCAASMDAYQSCVYVMPETGKCNDLCIDCPSYCRISGTVNLANMPEECKSGGQLIQGCRDCIKNYDSCTVSIASITALAPPAPNCSVCPAEMRLLGAGLPDEYVTESCSLSNCDKKYRAVLPRSTCESCLFGEESYTYSPPVNTGCGDMCAPSSNVPAANPGDFNRIGGDGLVGKPEIQEVAKMMLPAYVLPLFNIVATLIFIKSLSSFLGGDIEIPGLSKVF